MIERQLKDPREKTGELLSKRVELQVEKVGYEHQMAILDDKLAKLHVRSLIDGIVTSWDIENVLKNRPVSIGRLPCRSLIRRAPGNWKFICRTIASAT